MRNDGREFRARQREFRARPIQTELVLVELYEDLPNGETGFYRAEAYFIPPPTEPDTDPDDILAGEAKLFVYDPLREFVGSTGDRLWCRRWGKWLVPENSGGLAPCELTEALAAGGVAHAKALGGGNWQPIGENREVIDVFRTATANAKRGLWLPRGNKRLFVPVEC